MALSPFPRPLFNMVKNEAIEQVMGANVSLWVHLRETSRVGLIH